MFNDIKIAFWNNHNAFVIWHKNNVIISYDNTQPNNINKERKKYKYTDWTTRPYKSVQKDIEIPLKILQLINSYLTNINNFKDL